MVVGSKVSDFVSKYGGNAVTGTRDIAVVSTVFSFFGVISERWCDYVIQA